MEITQVKISKLKPSEYNPRKWDQKAIEQLTESIKRFGLVDPIIVNSAKERHNIVIGGHFRLEVAKRLGYTEVPVYYINIPDVRMEQELNIRLNKNVGDWDFDLLANIDEDLLRDVGFDEEELIKIFDLGEIDDKFNDDKFIENVICIQPVNSPVLKERIHFEYEYDVYEKIKKAVKDKILTADKILMIIEESKNESV